MSEPLAIVKPTSATARAGESLVPSPTKATLSSLCRPLPASWWLRCRASMKPFLSSGLARARMRCGGMPTTRAMAYR